MSATAPTVNVTADDIAEYVRQYKAQLVANILKARPNCKVFTEAKLAATPLAELQNLAATFGVDGGLVANAAPPVKVEPMKRPAYNWGAPAGGQGGAAAAAR